MVSETGAVSMECPNTVSLNPCCSGRWSQRPLKLNIMAQQENVLILVVVEDGLRVWRRSIQIFQIEVLIIVVVEDGLRGQNL